MRSEQPGRSASRPSRCLAEASAQGHWTISEWVDQQRTSQRVATCVGVIAISAAFLFLVGWLVGLTDGYGWAQAESATKLKARDSSQWHLFYEMAWRDIALYIPIYVAYGIAVILTLRPDPKRTTYTGKVWKWALCALGVLGAVDVAETAMFQWSLRRLKADGVDADISSIASVTGVLTWVKIVMAAVTLIVVCVIIFSRPVEPEDSPST